MRKSVAAVAVGMLLVAGQAAASGAASSARVGDRIGARSDASSEFAAIPLPILFIGGILVIGAITVVANDDDAESA